MQGRNIAMWEGTYGDMGRQKFELGYKEEKWDAGKGNKDT